MPPSAADLLKDVRAAAGLIVQFTAGRALSDYSTDALMRSAVERQFIIVGEALAQRERLDPATAARLPTTLKSSPSATSSFMATARSTIKSSGR